MTIATAAAVERLLHGRLDHEATAPLTEDDAGLTLEQAYAIQREVERALVARGERVIGWKVGFTSAALQESFGVSEPVMGFLLGLAWRRAVTRSRWRDSLGRRWRWSSRSS